MLDDCIEKDLGSRFRLLRLAKLLVQFIDGGVLSLERFSGSVQINDKRAQFASRVRRSNAYAQISGPKLLGHHCNSVDRKPDTDFRQGPYRGNEQD